MVDQRLCQHQLPVRHGVLGADPFGSVLDEIVRGEEVQGHPLVVVRYSMSRTSNVPYFVYQPFGRTAFGTLICETS